MDLKELFGKQKICCNCKTVFESNRDELFCEKCRFKKPYSELISKKQLIEKVKELQIKKGKCLHQGHYIPSEDIINLINNM